MGTLGRFITAHRCWLVPGPRRVTRSVTTLVALRYFGAVVSAGPPASTIVRQGPVAVPTAGQVS
jgi:hypothetical protein